jgi:hypothetical protein
MKLGDAVASIATPIARSLQLPCIDPQTQQLRPDSPCAKRQEALNNFSDAVYDVFWKRAKEKYDQLHSK